MKVKIENMSDCRIAFMRVTGPYGVYNTQMMDKLKEWAKSKQLLNEDSVILGIPQDNPKFTEPEKCRYDICLLIDEGFVLNDASVSIGRVSGGKHVVYEINHTTEAVQEAWTSILDKIGNNELEFDSNRPIIERYAVHMVNNHLCEICVPIC